MIVDRIDTILQKFSNVPRIVDSSAAIIGNEFIVGIGVFQYVVNIVSKGNCSPFVTAGAIAGLISRQITMIIFC